LSSHLTEEHIANLEAEQAFQSETIRELHEALAAQQQDLTTIKRQLKLLAEQLRGLRESVAEGSGGAAPDNDKPPHY
jgi:uncharacterized coiled-coil protein SlyX